MKAKKITILFLGVFLLSSNVFADSRILPDDCLSPSLKIQTQDIFTLFRSAISGEDNNDVQKQLSGLNEAQRYFAEKIIAQGGKITFADFMREALYSDHGFFTNNAAVGRDKSFDTYAEILPFGYALSKQITEMWNKMGKPKKFSIVEMGAGSGALARNILKSIKENEPEFYKSIDYVIIEISPKLKSDQEATLKREFGSLAYLPVSWAKGTALDLSELRDVEGVFLSNEMPDNFPVHRVKKVKGDFKEIYVTFKNGKLQDELGPLSDKDLRDYVAKLPADIKEGVELPVNLDLKIWQENLAKALKKGFVITIDYGGKINEITQNPYAVWNMETNRMEDLKAKMEYLYANSGSCDITAEVNFYDLADYGKENGLQVQGYTLQRDFLGNLGFEDIMDDLVSKGVTIPRRKSVANDIATNFHFKVLVQSKGVDPNISLEGLDGMEDFYFQYGNNVRMTLPLGPQDSKFIVITNDINFNKDTIKNGKQAVIDERRSYGFSNSTNIIEDNSDNVENGKYIFSLSRKDIADINIYNDKGQLIFDGWDYFERQGKGKDLSFDYDTFEEKYLTNFDLTKMQTEAIPDVFYLHQDGLLQTFPPVFLPKGALDKQTSPESGFAEIMEQAI